MDYRRVAACLAATITTLACATAGERSGTSPDDMVAVARLMVTLDRVISEEDLPELIDLVADDAVYMLPDAPAVVGVRAIGEYYREFFQRYDIEVRHEPLEIDDAGDFIIHRGNVTGTVTSAADGQSVTFSDKYLFVIKKQPDGSLLVWRAVFNSNAPRRAP